MKINILSDLTLEPVVKRLEALGNTAELQFTYADNLPLYLHTSQQAIEHCDILILHTDIFFSNQMESYKILLRFLVENMADWAGTILLPTQKEAYPAGQVKDAGIRFGDAELIGLLENAKQLNNLYFYDFFGKVAEVGTQNVYHFGLGHMYQMPYTKMGQQILAECLAENILFFTTPEKKVIVLDGDNTLWGGILGEDGEESVLIDKNAAGILYLQFQEFLKKKKNEGFLLCICSKNNEADVEAVFAKRKMPLEWNDFTIAKINWKDKYSNLQEIAKELNVGLDSFIFIDDSDFETQSIREMLPEIAVLKFSNQYSDLRKLMQNMLFRKKRILEEDKRKTEVYRAENARKSVAAGLDNFTDFIESLEIVTTLVENDTANIGRLAQLTEKTNQFNFHKEALTENELLAFIHSGNTVLSASVTDKFGDYGIIGLMLLEKKGNEAILRNFLMSCRALGRGVEGLFVQKLDDWLQANALKLNRIEFIKTEKNTPAALFLPAIQQKFGII